MYWNRAKSCCASESLLWALITDMGQRKPKWHFCFEDSLEKATFWHFEETKNLIKLQLLCGQSLLGPIMTPIVGAGWINCDTWSQSQLVILLDTSYSWNWVDLDTGLLCAGAQQVVLAPSRWWPGVVALALTLCKIDSPCYKPYWQSLAN